MFEHRPYARLGGDHLGWLDTKHHFSFGSYHDPQRMGWGTLRVWNDDTIAPHTGFGPHPHRDMEIITYVREGAISHRDNLGHSGKTVAGDVQVMSAGTGIVHAEHNDEDVPTKIFQIWIMPNQPNLAPRWESRPLGGAGARNQWVVLASANPTETQTMRLNADARLLALTLEAGHTAHGELQATRRAYLVVARGQVTVAGHRLQPGDGLAVHEEHALTVTATSTSELLMVDVASYASVRRPPPAAGPHEGIAACSFEPA